MSVSHRSAIEDLFPAPKDPKKSATASKVAGGGKEAKVAEEPIIKNFCQRCLNHGLENPRKGHKENCRYLYCECTDCYMIERRRILNRALKDSQLTGPGSRKGKDKNRIKSREMYCAKCNAHGIKVLRRGHCRRICENDKCTCRACVMIEERRLLMARQIKLRRKQHREKMAAMGSSRSCDENSVTSFSEAGSPLPRVEAPVRVDSPIIVDDLPDQAKQEAASVLVRLIRQPPTLLQLPIRPAIVVPQNNPFILLQQSPTLLNLPLFYLSIPGVLTRDGLLNSCMLPWLHNF